MNDKEQPIYKRLWFIITTTTIAILILVGAIIGIVFALKDDSKDKDKDDKTPTIEHHVPTSANEVEDIINVKGTDLFKYESVEDMSIFNGGELGSDWVEIWSFSGTAEASIYFTYNQEENYIQQELDFALNDCVCKNARVGQNYYGTPSWKLHIAEYQNIVFSTSNRFYLDTHSKASSTSILVEESKSNVFENGYTYNSLAGELKNEYMWRSETQSDKFAYGYTYDESEDDYVSFFTFTNLSWHEEYTGSGSEHDGETTINETINNPATLVGNDEGSKVDLNYHEELLDEYTISQIWNQ